MSRRRAVSGARSRVGAASGRPGAVRCFIAAGALAATCLLSALLAPWPARSADAGSQAGSTTADIKQKLEGLSPREQVDFLQSLRSASPGEASVAFYLGNAYLNLSKTDSAIVYYEEAIAADSMYSKAHVNMGIALERVKRYDEAKSHYERAIEIDSTDVLAYCHLGHYLHVRGELGEAVELYQRALEADPESAQAHYNLGLAFADSRLFGEAIREWRKVMALSPDSEIGRTAAENVRLIETYIDMDGGARKEP